MSKTKIEWCDETINPIVGCSKVSDGCTYCYAEIMANRLAYNPATKDVYSKVITDGKWNGKTAFNNKMMKKLDKLRRSKKPRTVFINSMCDLFHESADEQWIDDVFTAMYHAKNHTFIILTKRPERMCDYLVQMYSDRTYVHPDLTNINMAASSNIIFGVSVEDQKAANERIPELLKLKDYFNEKICVSVEPLIDSVDLTKLAIGVSMQEKIDALNGFRRWCGHVTNATKKVDWVIVGGESGKKARPMHPKWVRSVRDQCKAAYTPFFFKGWGEYMPFQDATNIPGMPLSGKIVKVDSPLKDGDDIPGKVEMIKVGKKYSGNLLDGKTHEEFPG